MKGRSVPLAGLLASLLSGACGGGQVSEHTRLETVEPLRTSFNSDSGKVRAIFLAAPT